MMAKCSQNLFHMSYSLANKNLINLQVNHILFFIYPSPTGLFFILKPSVTYIRNLWLAIMISTLVFNLVRICYVPWGMYMQL